MWDQILLGLESKDEENSISPFMFGGGNLHSPIIHKMTINHWNFGMLFYLYYLWLVGEKCILSFIYSINTTVWEVEYLTQSPTILKLLTSLSFAYSSRYDHVIYGLPITDICYPKFPSLIDRSHLVMAVLLKNWDYIPSNKIRVWSVDKFF